MNTKAKKLLDYLNESTNNNRSLLDSVFIPDIKKVLKLWINEYGNSGILIGGLAVSFWARPRATVDIDLLFRDDQWDKFDLKSFKLVRPHAYREHKTHAEVEIVNPKVTNNKLTTSLIDQVIKTAHLDKYSNMKIASREALIVLKLKRNSRQDQADIISLLKSSKVNISPWIRYLDKSELDMYNQLVIESDE